MAYLIDLAISKNENPEIALINNLLQAISEYDKLKTVQRLQSGRRRAKKMGKSIGGQTKVGETEEEKKMLERLGALEKSSSSWQVECSGDC